MIHDIQNHATSSNFAYVIDDKIYQIEFVDVCSLLPCQRCERK